MVDFFTENLWETLLTSEMRKNLLCLSSDELSSLPSLVTSSARRNDLVEFITSAKAHQLMSWGWVNCRDVFIRDNNDKPRFIDYCMKPKKSYEVELMSEVVNILAKQFNIRTVLDLGSGKGYLSQYLAMQYRLHVIGIDCKPQNTENAKKRNAKVEKVWSALASKIGSSQTATTHSEKRCSETENKKLDLDINISTSVHHSFADEEKKDESFISKTDKQNNLQSSDYAQENIQNFRQKHDKREDFECPEIKNKSKRSQLRGRCPNVNQTINCEEFCRYREQTPSNFSLPQENQFTRYCFKRDKSFELHPYIESENEINIGCEHCGENLNFTLCKDDRMLLESASEDNKLVRQDGRSYVPVTGFVESHSPGGTLASILEQGQQKELDQNVFVVGLHTCGDLGPTALRIFINKPQVQLLCVVGCCYHLLSQDYSQSSEAGFPLSSFLKEQQFSLSRNATMVAQQAANKLACENKLPPKSILYRAVLQVMLKEKYGLDGKGYHVGRIGAKCKTFLEYVHKAIGKLKLEEGKITEEEIMSYMERFKDREQEIIAFHQVRAILAPCIESLIVLDRLCYLYEQNVDSACVVRMFDPAKSPRCFAIVAAKSDPCKDHISS